jgi:hypothetical protein
VQRTVKKQADRMRPSAIIKNVVSFKYKNPMAVRIIAVF